MTLPAPTYDLMLLLDPQADPDARAKIVEDARGAIAAKGELVNDADWGARSLTYPIAHKKDAQYHLLQFHVSDTALLSELDRTLRITDGVMRFRIVKLEPGTPAAPDVRAGHVSTRPAAETTPAPTAAEDAAEEPTGEPDSAQPVTEPA